MKTSLRLLGFAGALALAVTMTVTHLSAETPASAGKPSADQLARGRYLVFRTGLCTDCHSPRDEQGKHIESRHLTGAPIPFLPTVPMPWVPAAPRLAGLPAGYTQDEFVVFLMTGERPGGRGQALPPMPPFRFDRDDAEAIAAFLKSYPVQ